MYGKREAIVLVVAGALLLASVAGVLQIADVRRGQHLVEPLKAVPGDADGDGIPDASDACPAAPETFNGFQDQDGCPDTVARTRAS